MAHRRVGAHGLIALPRHENELPVGDHVPLRPGPVHPRGMKAQAQQQPDLRHHHALPERHAALERRHRQEVGPLPLQGADRPGQQLGLVPGVGIGEQQDRAAGLPRALFAGPWLPVPPRRQRLSRDQPRPRVPRCDRRYDLGGAVGGAVVDDQDLGIHSGLGHRS